MLALQGNILHLSIRFEDYLLKGTLVLENRLLVAVGMAPVEIHCRLGQRYMGNRSGDMVHKYSFLAILERRLERKDEENDRGLIGVLDLHQHDLAHQALLQQMPAKNLVLHRAVALLDHLGPELADLPQAQARVSDWIRLGPRPL
jgi:hypothetical protein